MTLPADSVSSIPDGGGAHPPEALAATSIAEQVVELLEEEVLVSKRLARGETVRVETTTRLHEQQIEEALARETVEVERVAIGRVVDAAPAIREEGDFVIVPVMEEVLVVERRLVLKEEVRLRRVRTTQLHRETVPLRQQVATVSRVAADGVLAEPMQPPTEKEEHP